MDFRYMFRCTNNCAPFLAKPGVSKNEFVKICRKQIYEKKKFFIMPDSYFPRETS